MNKSQILYFFRVDCHPNIGIGHLIRCLNLAHVLSENNKIIFIGKGYPKDLIPKNYIVNQMSEYDSTSITKDPNTWLGTTYDQDAHETLKSLMYFQNYYDLQKYHTILIIDHYAIDKKWEELVQSQVDAILVIDDLVNREHSCDFLVDHTYRPVREIKANPYKKLLEVSPKNQSFLKTPSVMLGIRYCLLNDEFRKARKTQIVKHTSNKDFQIKKLMISFGGSDPQNQTTQVLKIILELIKTNNFLTKLTEIYVVCGKLFNHQSKLQEVLNLHHNSHINLRLCQAINQTQMIDLMCQTDVCIGGGGVSCYERCSLGIPSLVITVADNQKDNAKNLHSHGAIDWLGDYRDHSDENLTNLIRDRLSEINLSNLFRMEKVGLALVDGLGCTRIRTNIKKLFY